MTVQGVDSAFPELNQPKKGYRYGIDSFLLARFANFRSGETICDLGAGVGILGLLALCRAQVKRVVAVEVQEELARFSLENSRILGVADRFEVLLANWRELPRLIKPRSFDVVVSNPPYRKVRTGKVPPDHAKAIAKHEIAGSLSDLVTAAAHLMKPSGRFLVMYPPLRLEELILELHLHRLKIQRMAAIHSYSDRPATHIMVEAVRASTREITIEPPVVVYRDPDHLTQEIEAWVGPKRRV